MLPFQNIYTETELTENGSGKIPFVFCKLKTETEVSFSWLANDKR
jgi:hypothetical protein